MSIGLFLDVDKTLTKDYIQKIYAIALGVYEDYDKIEKEYNETGRSDIFGDKFINILRNIKFTEKQAISFFEKIELQPWTKKLKNLPVEKYLVSSGPNYYINNLANELLIPKDNVLCSVYEFDNEGIVCDCLSINSNSKANFVLKKKKKHLLTIGVGDSELNDGPFISNCDISILTNPSNSFLSMNKSLESLFTMIENLIDYKKIPNTNKINCFIGSSSEKLSLASSLQGLLQDHNCTSDIWKYKFKDKKTVIENLENICKEYDYAIYFITPDDLLEKKGVLNQAVRDNIILEIGLFYGSIGRDRCFLLAPKSLNFDSLPSDLFGITFKVYNDNIYKENNIENIKNMLNPIANEIANEMKSNGILRKL